jgi:hypothetical protein
MIKRNTDCRIWSSFNREIREGLVVSDNNRIDFDKSA